MDLNSESIELEIKNKLYLAILSPFIKIFSKFMVLNKPLILINDTSSTDSW